MPARAAALVKKASGVSQVECDKGSLDECVTLGLAYQWAIGLPKDVGRAAALFKKACDGGEQSGCTQAKELAQAAVVSVRWLRATLFAALAAAPAWTQPSVRVGPDEIVMSKLEREKKRLPHWPDGSFGFQRSSGQDGYDFFAANGGKIAVTSGTLEQPAARVRRNTLGIEKMRQRYDYAAGGPVYRDPATGRLLLFYHAERWPNGDAKRFYATIGIARSSNRGKSFRDVGEIVRPNLPFGQSGGAVPIGGGALIAIGDYLYLYFRDFQSNGERRELAVARARIGDVLRAAFEEDRAAPWTKYWSSEWTEPGLGGRSTSLERGNPVCAWQSVAYSAPLAGYVMACVESRRGGQTSLALLTSADGLSWSSRRTLESDPGEAYYPTLVPIESGASPKEARLWLYYTFSPTGGFGRWRDAVLRRRLLAVAP